MKRIKKVLNATVLFVLPVFAWCQSQDKIHHEKEIIPLLCHEWMIKAKMDDSKKEYFPSETFSSVQFLANGKVFFKTGKNSEGSWKYDNKAHFLLLKQSGKIVKYIILNLTDKELVLENNNEGKLYKSHFWRLAEQ